MVLAQLGYLWIGNVQIVMLFIQWSIFRFFVQTHSFTIGLLEKNANKKVQNAIT